MYKLYITGDGSEITQGCLPIEIIDEIYSEIEKDSELPAYFIDAAMSDDKLNWFDVDDNFHAFGATPSSSTLLVENDKGEIVYEKRCNTLKCHVTYTTELYPEDFEFEPIGVLTCIEKFKGDFCIGYVNEDEFDLSNICLHINNLGDHSIIDSISYKGVELQDASHGDSISKDFIVYLEK